MSPLLRSSALLGALALVPLACGGAADAPRRPNVVFVVVDTLRADHMSLYGYERPTTPNLDARAQAGLVFEHALAGSSWTLPSMAMLFTGTYKPANLRRLDEASPSFVEAFDAAGYRTGGVVSNPLLGRVLGPSRPDTPPVVYDSGFERGFDHYDVYQHDNEAGLPEFAQANGWYGDEVVARGTAWVESSADQAAPYFLYLHLFDPHFPRVPRERGLFEPLEVPLPPATTADLRGSEPPPGVSAQQVEAALAWATSEVDLYDEEVAHVDAALEQLFGWLEARGELEDAVVVLTSDHGEGLWERPLPPGEHPKPYNQLRSHYSDHGIQLYDEQVRVPLVIWAPGLEPGRRTDASVSLLDVAPSLRYLADLPAPESALTAGVNLFEQHPRARNILSVTTRGASLTEAGRWRLHQPAPHLVERFGAAPELYDLAADPEELRPLDEPERVAAMVETLAALQELVTAPAELDAEELELRRALLDALGYTDQ